MLKAFRPWFASLAAAAGVLTLTSANALVGGIATTEFGQVGRGVQVLPNWVITARHVGLDEGGTFTNGYGSAIVAERYNFADGAFPLDDLALLRLETAIAAPSLSLVASTVPVGGGYAIPATLTTGLNQAPRGYGFSEVREFLPVLDPDDDGPLGAVSANFLVAYTAGYGTPYVQGGDSGGGLFLGHVTSLAGGAPLWGIASAYIAGKDDNGNDVRPRSGFIQLVSYRSWLDSTIQTHSVNAQSLNWVAASVPEPSALLMLGAGLAVLALRRRR